MGKTIALNFKIAELHIGNNRQAKKSIKVADSDKLKNDIKQAYTELLTEQIANGTIEVSDNYGQALSISNVLPKLKWVSMQFFSKHRTNYCNDRPGVYVKRCTLMASTERLTDKPEALILSKAKIRQNSND